MQIVARKMREAAMGFFLMAFVAVGVAWFGARRPGKLLARNGFSPRALLMHKVRGGAGVASTHGPGTLVRPLAWARFLIALFARWVRGFGRLGLASIVSARGRFRSLMALVARWVRGSGSAGPALINAPRRLATLGPARGVFLMPIVPRKMRDAATGFFLMPSIACGGRGSGCARLAAFFPAMGMRLGTVLFMRWGRGCWGAGAASKNTPCCLAASSCTGPLPHGAHCALGT